MRDIAWYLADEAVGRVRKNQTIFRKIEQDNCFIIQQIVNESQNESIKMSSNTFQYSGTPLIRPPTGQQVVLLTKYGKLHIPQDICHV